MSRSKSPRSATLAAPSADEQGASFLDQPLPEEVTNMREFMQMTHDELAEQLGVSKFAVRSWESGRHGMTAAMARKLRDLYNRYMGFDKIELD